MNTKNISRKIGGFALAALMVTGITVFSTSEASAQRRIGRSRGAVVRTVRPYRPYRSLGFYRPFRPFGWYGYGYGNGFYDNGFYGNSFYNSYSQYVFDNSAEAAQSALKQGYKTGEEDGRKEKSFSFERSHFYKEAGFGNFGEVYRKNFAGAYENGYAEGAEKAEAKAREKAAKNSD
jgi:hypothetical protein